MSSLRSLRSSGTGSLDKAAEIALGRSELLPLPHEFGPHPITMRVAFHYNEAPRQKRQASPKSPQLIDELVVFWSPPLRLFGGRNGAAPPSTAHLTSGLHSFATMASATSIRPSPSRWRRRCLSSARCSMLHSVRMHRRKSTASPGLDPAPDLRLFRSIVGWKTDRSGDNELAAVRRGFNLARRKGILLANELPTAWPQLAQSDPREGFFERDEQERVRAALPPDVGDLEFLFWCGWRSGEAKGLRWTNVDTKARVIRIPTSKAKEPRTLPYGQLPALVDLITHRREVTDAVQSKRGMVVTHVFHRNGGPIGSFRKTWISACIAAGLGREVREPDKVDAKGRVIKRGRLIEKEAFRIPHDFRRTAARNPVPRWRPRARDHAALRVEDPQRIRPLPHRA